jgi:hypothetical protein
MSMESSLNSTITNYRVLTSFREPLSHFLSACIHSAMNLKKHNDSYKLRNAVAALKLGKTIPGHYNLRNFQTSYLVNGSITPEMLTAEDNSRVIASAKDYLKSIYWFSLSEHMTLSLALLQCQVFGVVRPDLLADANRIPKLNAHTNIHESLHINSMILADIHSLIKTDISMYELIIKEFWDRIKKQKDCLKNYTTTDGLFLAHYP